MIRVGKEAEKRHWGRSGRVGRRPGAAVSPRCSQLPPRLLGGVGFGGGGTNGEYRPPSYKMRSNANTFKNTLPNKTLFWPSSWPRPTRPCSWVGRALKTKAVRSAGRMCAGK